MGGMVIRREEYTRGYVAQRLHAEGGDAGNSGPGEGGVVGAEDKPAKLTFGPLPGYPVIRPISFDWPLR